MNGAKHNYPEDAIPNLDVALKRPPDFVIGNPYDPYLQRWWVIPRNKLFNIYLHKICADDDDTAHHDHPWWNISIPLKGRIVEHRTGKNTRIMKPFRIYLRSARTGHRLEIGRKRGNPFKIGGAWTLFITGPKIRAWGFLCPEGWVHWKDFTGSDNSGQIGRGCGEME